MPRPELEAKLEREVRDYAESRGCMLEKVSSLSRRGWPDRELIGPGGVTIRLEFKRSGKTLDPHQEYVIGKLRALGHEVWMIDNFKAAKVLVDSLFIL